MDAPPELRDRDGIARLLFAACFLPFAIATGVLFLGTVVSQPGGLLAAASYILSFIFALVGLGVGVDGSRRMTRRQG